MHGVYTTFSFYQKFYFWENENVAKRCINDSCAKLCFVRLAVRRALCKMNEVKFCTTFQYMRCFADPPRRRSKIWENEVQRVNRIYCVRRAERSDSEVRVQRAFSVSLTAIHVHYNKFYFLFLQVLA